MADPVPPPSVAEIWLRQLRRRGVDFLFANSGTDFPPIIEALARCEQLGIPVPKPVIAPHENVAVAMAHGYAAVTGRAQAAMVHVNVGTANALAGLLNAERDYVPLVLAAGRTPVLEAGAPGARSLNIHWAQEMFDQGGMVREAVRWDFELRHPAQVTGVTDRALAIAHSVPRGPVYLTLPRELLAMPAGPEAEAEAEAAIAGPAMQPVRRIGPDPQTIRDAAAALTAARCPIIITARAGADRAVPPLLGTLAERVGAPVIEYRPRYLNLSTDHRLHGGFESGPFLAAADLVLVLDCDVPWIPALDTLAPGAIVIQAGEDPLQARYPTRLFPATLTLPGSAALVIAALIAELGETDFSARRDAAIAACAARRAKTRPSDPARTTPARATRAWISACIDHARAPGSVLVNEYPLVREAMNTTESGGFYGSSPSGALGWGLPAALGVKLASPGQEVIAALGDGSHLFANPIACHQLAAAEGIAVLAVVFNDRGWNAVRRATLAMYPDGYAARANVMPLTRLDPTPDFARIAEACGIYGRQVSDPAALPAALAEALAVVRGGRSAVLDVLCEG